MGLAASQVRLLSLTSRQHSIENQAEYLQNCKVRLANDSDQVYQVYLNALDETLLKTMQTSTETGDSSWIDGSIYNLLRYETSDTTTGNVFYVQDILSGKLYIPEEMGKKYDASVDAMNFAEQYGITYTLVDYNEDVLINYQKALDNGWDSIMDETTLTAYYTAANKDSSIKTIASMMLNFIPEEDDDGMYLATSSQTSIASNFINEAAVLMGSNEYTTEYTSAERAIIESAYNLLLEISNSSSYIPEDTETETTPGSFIYDSLTTTTEYTTSQMSAVSGSTTYITTDSGEEYSLNDYYALMLNGGTTTWTGTKTVTNDYYKNDEIKNTSSSESDATYTYTIYDSTDTTLLSNYGASSYGEALTAIFTRVLEDTDYTGEFLTNYGLSETDVSNYLKYLNLLSEYEAYEPDYENVPSDTVLGPYYEQIYNAITAAGGWIGVSDTRGQNATWVSNMIKNAQVILTTWDSDDEMLSRTSSSLNTSLKEVTNDALIEKASEEYEAEMEEINNKDTTYDTILSTLETERSSITTEIEALENIAKENIEKNFKAMG